MIPFLSDTLSLTRAGPGLWRGEADPAYSNGLPGAALSQFGGWVAAAMLKAALGEAPEGQHARALSAQFFLPIRPGPLSIGVRALRKGRSISFLQAELSQGEDVRAQAAVTVGAGRQDALAHHFAPMPEVAPSDADGLGDFSPPTPFGRMLRARWIEGAPFTEASGARSLFWSRTREPTRLDAPALAMLADYMPPRVFYVARNFVQSSTLSLNVQFHATQAELEAVYDRGVLADVRGRRIADGYGDHTASFWSPDGVLLSTSEQIAVHRG